MFIASSQTPIIIYKFLLTDCFNTSATAVKCATILGRLVLIQKKQGGGQRKCNRLIFYSVILHTTKGKKHTPCSSSSSLANQFLQELKSAVVMIHLCVVCNENVSRLSLQSSTCFTSLWLKGKSIILETKLNSLRFLNLSVFIRVWWTLQSTCFTLKRSCFGRGLFISFWFVLLKKVSMWRWACLQQNMCSPELES